MRREFISFLIGLALIVGLVAPALAGGDPGLNAWIGSGPFATGLGNRVVTALAVSPDGATLYAGTGSGSVFIYVNDSDNDGVADDIDNCPTVANPSQSNANGNSLGDACDPADSDGDGFSDEEEVAAGSDPNDLATVPALVVTVAPATMATDYQGLVQLTIGPLLAGAAVTVEQIVDVNGNGQVDTEEPALRSFTVTDGVASLNPNVLGDSDGAVNSSITVALNLRDPRDIHHLPGSFLFWAGDGSRTDITPLSVTTSLGSQSISGTVSDGINPVPGVLVTLRGKGFTDTGLGAFTDGTGQYRIEVPTAGDFHVDAEDYTGQWVTTEASGNALVTIAAGQHVTGINRTLSAGNVAISGNAGAPGVKVIARNATVYTQALTNSDGTYQLLVPGDSYEVSVQPTDHLGLNPSSKGLVGEEAFSQSVDATTNVPGVDFTLAPATTAVSGTVRDEFGVTLPGMNVVAVNNTDPVLPVAMAVTATDGSYTLGLNAADPWSLSVNGNRLWPQDLLSSYINNYSTVTSPASGNDLTVYAANAWIIGTVTDATGQPLSKVKVYGWSGALFSGGTTDLDGTYRLPARGGLAWIVDAMTEAAGQGDVAPQSVPLSNGQTATLNFAVPLPPSAAPASITVPATNATGSYAVSWAASATAGVNYVLQESTDATFTVGVRQAYLGRGTTASITGRLNGRTYYYRVRAQKAGYAVSDYTTAGNGCAVTIPSVAPASLTVPATNATGSYAVSWAASVTAGVNYVLQESTDATFTVGVRQAYLGTATTANITGRLHGRTYYYRVRAQNGGYATSDYRTAGNGCTVAIPSVAPASLTVPATSATGSYAVSWAASVTAGVTYVLQESTDATFAVGVRQAYVGTATTANITDRLSGRTYYYRVRAQNGGYATSDYRTAGNGCWVGP